MAKQYGLIKSEKGKVIIRPSIFNESSDSDDNSQKPTGTQNLKRKEKIAQEKVLAEDPTVYQYDELYDEMQSKRIDSKLARKDLDKKPKYICKLLETAERRKRENERRIERDVQKEREIEGDMYKDKESFVTSSYKKKLEEMKELEEKEKREEYLESIGDVKKQGDLGGFYRHLYAQQVNFEEETEKKETRDKQKESDKQKEKSPDPPEENKNLKQKRKYRKRLDSKSSDEDTKKETKLEHLPSNLDADSDFSIDSDSDSESEPKKVKTEIAEPENKPDSNVTPKLEEKVTVKEENEPDKEGNDKEEIKVEEKPKKPKIDIWKKRTVGDLLDDAVKRFYERKSLRIGAF